MLTERTLWLAATTATIGILLFMMFVAPPKRDAITSGVTATPMAPCTSGAPDDTVASPRAALR